MASLGGVSNPITPQAAVVTNGEYDRWFKEWRTRGYKETSFGPINGEHSADPSVYSMMPRELCFRLSDSMNRPISRPACGGVNDLPLKIFTSFNSFPVDASVFEKIDGACAHPSHNAVGEMLKQVFLNERAVFVGVPLIPINASVGHQKDTVSVCVAGGTTITNTGSDKISIGSKVYVHIPTSYADRASQASYARQNGQPEGKALGMTMEYKPVDMNKRITQFCNMMGPGGAGSSREKLNQLAHQLSMGTNPVLKTLCMNKEPPTFEEVSYLVTSTVRFVGIALTEAPRGRQFDILVRGAQC